MEKYGIIFPVMVYMTPHLKTKGNIDQQNVNAVKKYPNEAHLDHQIILKTGAIKFTDT